MILKSASIIIFSPQVAGNITPAFSKASGSISTGNMIPESIMEGKNSNCENIVSFEVLRRNSPNTVPMVIQIRINILSETKDYNTCNKKMNKCRYGIVNST